MTTLVPVLLAVVLVILLTSKLKLNAFFSLIVTALMLALVTLPVDEVISTLTTGFGNTLAKIGLIILFGTTIGVILDKTGAARSVALAVLRRTGPRKAPRAIAVAGFITGMPIFCDSGFIVLSGLNRSLARQSGVPTARMAGTLAIVLYVLHCLIPPHPGITAAAGTIGGSVGRLVLLGTAVAIPSALAGYLWVKLAARRIATPEVFSSSPAEDDPAALENLPSLLPSLLPVAAPLVLITLGSILGTMTERLSPWGTAVVELIGSPVVALLIGILLALPLVRGGRRRIDQLLAEAVEKAGPILAVTAAGGAFGAAIQATGFGEQISGLLTASSLGLLVPFLLAAMLKTAQGSSTVAAITTASIVVSLLPSLGLDGADGRLLALLAIGSGSMPLSHANDSYFWVVTRFSDIPPDVTFKVYSSATVVTAACSFALTWGLAFFIL